jgi:hypothetical protein
VSHQREKYGEGRKESEVLAHGDMVFEAIGFATVRAVR